MPKEHWVIVKDTNGTAVRYRMKEWLRQHPEHLPVGLDPTSSTSHELRRGLRHNGWVMQEQENKVLLLLPYENGDVAYANEIMLTDADSDDEGGNEKEILEAEEITFGLERDMQKALRVNIAQLEPGLTIIDGGKEKTTEAGRIDITAKDEQDNIVVIELKAGKATPDVIAQILSYMGVVGETGDSKVRGLLVAGDFHKRVVLASKAIPNLRLKKYSFQFSFSDIT